MDQRDAVVVGQICQIRNRHVGYETIDSEVGGMHLQHRSAIMDLEGGGVVTESGSVGGPDFDETCATRFHHQWEPERSADLDQLSPGHRDSLARGGGGQGEQHRRRVVVDHEGILRAVSVWRRALRYAPRPPRPPSSRSSSRLV